MNFIEIVLIGIGLAMDSFAISICKGLELKKMNWKYAATIAAFFGLCHVGMLILGYYLGEAFSDVFESVGHWIAFGIFLIIGGKMIKESFDGKSKRKKGGEDLKAMFLLALATSIDALAVGVTFAFLEANIFVASITVGLIIILLSILGVKIGNKFGGKIHNKAELLGGIVLILIGLKILLEHLGVFGV